MIRLVVDVHVCLELEEQVAGIRDKKKDRAAARSRGDAIVWPTEDFERSRNNESSSGEGE